MVKSERNADGFATIALENHWGPWFTNDQNERLGFGSVDSIDLVHKTKRGRSHFQDSSHMDLNSRGSQGAELGQTRTLAGLEFLHGSSAVSFAEMERKNP
jgi:hypothetical protein